MGRYKVILEVKYMPGPQPKKMLILNILQILKDYTDSTNPDHKLTQKEIMEHLEHDYDMVVDVPMIPFGLMNALTIKIIPDRDYDEYETKKPDALIVKKPLVIAAIEYKIPAQLRTEKQIEKAIAQELGTAQALQAKVYIITDGKKSIWVNPANGHEILQEDGSKITLNFDKNNAECIVLINKIRTSINATNDTLKAAASVDPLPLAEKVWQDLWAVSGATPENCLYTFVEIFIFKYLSDLGVLKGMYSFYDLLSKTINVLFLPQSSRLFSLSRKS